MFFIVKKSRSSLFLVFVFLNFCSAIMHFCHILKEKEDGTLGDLLIKQASSDKATIQATDNYAQRVSIDEQLSLLITGASLKDQNTFTCMVVSDKNLLEYPVSVVVLSKTSALLSLSASLSSSLWV